MARSLGKHFLSCLISFEMISTTFLLVKIALPLGWRFSHGFDDVTICRNLWRNVDRFDSHFAWRHCERYFAEHRGGEELRTGRKKLFFPPLYIFFLFGRIFLWTKNFQIGGGEILRGAGREITSMTRQSAWQVFSGAFQCFDAWQRERKNTVYTSWNICSKYFLYERKNFAYGCAPDLHFIEPCGCLYKAQLCTNKHQTIINIIIQLDFVALKKKK